MKKLLRSPRFYLLCALVSAFLATVAQTLAYLKAYGVSLSNYFLSTSPLPKIAVCLSILACALGLLAGFLWKKDEISLPTLQGDFAALPAAVGFLAGTVVMLLSNNTKLTYVIAAFFFIATLYHLILAFRLMNDPVIAALFGFSTLIGCILLVGYYYFDQSLEMNAPIKISVLIGILFAMLYYTGEIRILLGNPMPKMFIILSAALTGVGTLAALPVACAYLFFHCFDLAKPSALSASNLPYEHPEYLAGAMILIGVCCSSAWRLYRMIRTDENRQTPRRL